MRTIDRIRHDGHSGCACRPVLATVQGQGAMIIHFDAIGRYLRAESGNGPEGCYVPQWVNPQFACPADVRDLG